MSEIFELERTDSWPVLELPTDHRRPLTGAFRMDRIPIRLSLRHMARLEDLARSEDTDLSVCLLAAFAVLLSRYSGQEEFAIGTVGFQRAGQAESLAIHVDLSGQPTYRTLLSRVRKAVQTATSQAVDNQNLPTMFVLDDGSTSEGVASCAPLEATRLELALLLRSCAETRSAGVDAVEGLVQFAVDVFERSSVERMIEHLEVLLGSILANPSQPISQLDLLSIHHREQLDAWNATAAPLPDKCVHQVIEDQVRARPDAVALIYDETSLTYGQLNARANKLASYLIEQGVGRGSLVALCVDRGLDMVVGILGILKAGAAYVPIDALLYPPERIAFVLADASVQMLVTQRSLLERVPASRGPKVLCLDDEAVALRIDAGSVLNPSPGTTLDDLAYVIYTSGSTGTPKGVMVEHRGLTNLFVSIPSIVGVGPHDRHLQFAPVSFDMSIGDILLSLCFGATLCIAPLDSLHSGQALAVQLREQRITHATVAPSVLARIPEGEEFPDLTAVAVAAETCPAHIVARWAPGRLFFNVYGPTETTIAATVAECRPQAVGDPPIGRPLPNVRVHVVDEELQLVPIGVPGELCIAGVGVSRGYLGRPDLTAERFVQDPFGPPGERLYRTGDRARWRPDGDLEFLGRTDDQVKLRGYRIELGEIETTLRRHDLVREAAVVLDRSTAEPAHLAAYVVADTRPSDDELREFLGRTLPYYMVPRHYVWLDSLPLTPNGKVDRRNLPSPPPRK